MKASLTEEGQYNLHSMKEIFSTGSFMGLDYEKRKCQETKAYDKCKTSLHVEMLRQKCGCLPLSLRLSEQVDNKLGVDM